jgi:exosome complex component CSL4
LISLIRYSFIVPLFFHCLHQGGFLKLIVPGDFLCYSEEYSANANAFEDADGKVFSSVVGCEQRDDSSRSTAVLSKNAKRPLRAGDLVYGRVEDLYDTVALLRMRPAAPSVAPHSDSAFLRISEIRRGFVESFRGNIGIGDVLVARVKEVTPLGIYLTIIEDSLGVLRAFCSNCRNEMLFTQRGFYCKACATGEERKTPAAGAQPALFVQPARESERRGGMRGGGRGPPRRGGGGSGERFGGGSRGSRERGERNSFRRRERERFFRGGAGGERSGERGGGRREGRRDERRGERGGSRDSRGGFRRKNIGSYYPASP